MWLYKCCIDAGSRLQEAPIKRTPSIMITARSSNNSVHDRQVSREQGNKGTREQGNKGTREQGNKGTREQGGVGAKIYSCQISFA